MLVSLKNLPANIHGSPIRYTKRLKNAHLHYDYSTLMQYFATMCNPWDINNSIKMIVGVVFHGIHMTGELYLKLIVEKDNLRFVNVLSDVSSAVRGEEK